MRNCELSKGIVINYYCSETFIPGSTKSLDWNAHVPRGICMYSLLPHILASPPKVNPTPLYFLIPSRLLDFTHIKMLRDVVGQTEGVSAFVHIRIFLETCLHGFFSCLTLLRQMPALACRASWSSIVLVGALALASLLCWWNASPWIMARSPS